MTASPRSSVWLSLSETAEDTSEPAPWIGPLLALGTRVARFAQENAKRQLVIAISVPRRDFAAVLVGCGWVMGSEAPALPSPLETLRSLMPGTPVRAANETHVIAGAFSSLTESVDPPRAVFGGSTWRVDRIRAITALSALDVSVKTLRPEVGSVGRMAHLDDEWDARLVAPAADLAIVGTLAWLKEDLDACLGREDDKVPPSPIHNLLLPNLGRVATWFTRFYASARIADQLPLPADLRAVILDGAGAVKYLSDIAAPVVVCVIDRSIADETAAEVVMQLRSANSRPISLRDDLGWYPPAGIEALGFTVAQ